jgi:hypothetical protein
MLGSTLPTMSAQGCASLVLIHVVEGRLRYRILDPLSEEVLTPETPGVVIPTQPHEFEPLGTVRLFVEFFSARSDEGGPHTSQVL